MKKLLALVLALVMVFALAACGSGESTPTTDPNAGASTTPSGDDTPNVEPVTINIGYMNNYGSLWSLLAAREMGYFEEQGITVPTE